MNIIHNSAGGGANTNEHGLNNETHVIQGVLHSVLSSFSLIEENGNIYANKDGSRLCIGSTYRKKSFYNFINAHFPQKISMNPGNHHLCVSRDIWPHNFEPDFVLVLGGNVNIFEIKYQAGSGSVDEKIQTGPYKKREYEILLSPTFGVNYIFLLNDWFNQNGYRNVIQYNIENGCQCFFNSQIQEICNFFKPQIENALLFDNTQL
jgi:hypothetical protein